MDPKQEEVGFTLPQGVRPMSAQVGGHRYGDQCKSADGDEESKDNTCIGVLEYVNGTLLKEQQKPPRGVKEQAFYQELYSVDSHDPVMIKLREFTPTYFGVLTFPEFPGRQFLHLENILQKFHKPCVADIKIGRITYDPTSSEAKRKTSIEKYPPAQVIGFTFIGFKTYDNETDTYQQYDKFFCRKIPGDKMATEGLGKYFSIKHRLKKDLIKKMIDRLHVIEKWFCCQEQMHFFSTSLLLVYEGDTEKYPNMSSELVNTEELHSQSNKQNNNEAGRELSTGNDDIAKLVDVRMIDFAHVFPANSKDENFLHGLTSVIRHLEILLETVN